MKMNEDEILELTYRNPNKLPMTSEEKIKALEKLKLEVMASQPRGIFIPVINSPVVLDPDVFNPRKGIVTKYGKKLLEQGAKFYNKGEE